MTASIPYSGGLTPYTGIGPSGQSEYLRSVYGDATIDFVPPVTNYDYNDNIPKRGPKNGTFTWEEVTINLTGVMSGAIIEFVVPDSYAIQITPDIGWQSPTAMFGDDNDVGIQNPHFKTIGLYSVDGGTLTENGDGSVTAEVSETILKNSTTKGFVDHLWRAVPFANGQPGLGGFPARFEYISTESQLDFSIDKIIKETKHPNQVISGTKSNRATITIEDQNNPTVFVEQGNTSWRIWFTIDRPEVKFKIVATDSGGGIIGYHQVNLSYEAFAQYDGHVWNAFDSFGLFASITRIPGESNYKLKNRIKDAYTNKGGSHYSGLIKGINRELGIARIDSAIAITRTKDSLGNPTEDFISLVSTQTRISVSAQSMIRDEESKLINPYENTIFTDYRINSIISITINGIAIPDNKWETLSNAAGNEIRIDSSITGVILLTYSYYEDLDFISYPTLLNIISGINSMTNQKGATVLEATIDPRLIGSEPSNRIFVSNKTVSIDNTTIYFGWSPIRLNSIADEEWKKSFRDSKLMYFGSEFYRYILELKSQTNVEWGFVMADKDVWDAVGSDVYGNTHLPLVYDVSLSDWKLPSEQWGKISFDPWDAFRVGYYFNGILLKNAGMNKELFRSGVGFRKDCRVSLKFDKTAQKDASITFSPYISLPENTIDIDSSLIEDTILDI